MSSTLTELGELQLAILKALWGCESATVHEVVAALPEDRSPAYTTVLTVLRNLEKRGLVTHEQTEGERMFRYRAMVSEAETRTGLVTDLVERLFDGSSTQMIAFLLATYPRTQQETQALLELICNAQ